MKRGFSVKMLSFALAFIVVLAVINFAMIPRLGAADGSVQSVTGRFHLIDQDGKSVSQDSWPGQLRLMTFGYTFCPDICPTTLATMAAAIDKLGPDGARVVPIFVTVDSKRDTPAHLKDYVAAFHPRMVGLSGSPEAVADAAKQFKVRYLINPPEGKDTDSYTVDHSAGIWLMSPTGAFLAKLPHRMDADEVAERLRSALK